MKNTYYSILVGLILATSCEPPPPKITRDSDFDYDHKELMETLSPREKKLLYDGIEHHGRMGFYPGQHSYNLHIAMGELVEKDRQALRKMRTEVAFEIQKIDVDTRRREVAIYTKVTSKSTRPIRYLAGTLGIAKDVAQYTTHRVFESFSLVADMDYILLPGQSERLKWTFTYRPGESFSKLADLPFAKMSFVWRPEELIYNDNNREKIEIDNPGRTFPFNEDWF